MEHTTGHVRGSPGEHTERYIEGELAGESCVPDVTKALKMSPGSFLLRPP